MALFFRLLISKSFCLSETGKFMLDETKFIKNELLSIFFIAKEASEGIFGFLLIISKERSLIDSIIALNSELSRPGLTSGTSLMFAVIYGFLDIILSISNLFFPCIITVVFPSGICNTFSIFATVPTLYI